MSCGYRPPYAALSPLDDRRGYILFGGVLCLIQQRLDKRFGEQRQWGVVLPPNAINISVDAPMLSHCEVILR